MQVADGFIVTSLREGMALRTHEFVVVQEKEKYRPSNTEKEREGVLILSEVGFDNSYTLGPTHETVYGILFLQWL